MYNRISLLIFPILFLIINIKSYGQAELDINDLLSLETDDLFNIEIRGGTIIPQESNMLPVSITTITSRDIEITPARNIYDLIETFVPGALWMNHHDSPHIGIRGIITDRNYKYVLLVNGRYSNMKAHNGATSELENHDLTDIEEIQIIRGPGSVTYGPGAVAGIINIKTKDFRKKGLGADYSYLSEYNNHNLSLHYGSGNDTLGFSIFGSVSKTPGIKGIEAFRSHRINMIGYYTEEGNADLVNDYMRDYNDQPQLKFFTEIRFLNEWKAWARYTGAGSTQFGVAGKHYPQTGLNDDGSPKLGDYKNIKQCNDRHFTITLANEHDFGSNYKLSSMLSWDSEDVIRREEYFMHHWAFVPIPEDILRELGDINSIRNKYYHFSEDELLARFILNKEYENGIDAAVGIEYSRNSWGPGWGMDRTEFRMGDQHNIISGPDSKVYDTIVDPGLCRGVSDGEGYWVGDGWSTNTLSFLAEVNIPVRTNLNLLLSSRVDKDSYSELLFSPRFALIYLPAENNYLKLILQQSQRMNTADQLLIENFSGKKSDPETLNGMELIYLCNYNENLQFNISTFYNHLEVLSWFDDNRTTRLTGELSLAGIELETTYKYKGLIINLNHSYVKQVEWDMSDQIDKSGISYSDYNVQLDGSILTGTGNDLNNWANNTSKLIARLKLFEDKLLLHADFRIFWQYEGAKDGLVVIENAVEGNPDGEAYQVVVDRFREENAFKTNFSSNASVSWIFNDKYSISIYGMNIFSSDGFKRYTYEAGNKWQDQVLRGGFVIEPAVYGAKINIKL